MSLSTISHSSSHIIGRYISSTLVQIRLGLVEFSTKARHGVIALPAWKVFYLRRLVFGPDLNRTGGFRESNLI